MAYWSNPYYEGRVQSYSEFENFASSAQTKGGQKHNFRRWLSCACNNFVKMQHFDGKPVSTQFNEISTKLKEIVVPTQLREQQRPLAPVSKSRIWPWRAGKSQHHCATTQPRRHSSWLAGQLQENQKLIISKHFISADWRVAPTATNNLKKNFSRHLLRCIDDWSDIPPFFTNKDI